MIKLFAAAGAAAVLSLAAPTAAFANGGDQALARGAVSEVVSGGDWHISFDIQARDHGWNSSVTVRNPVEAFSFTGALCTGTYHDPVYRTSVLHRRPADLVPGFRCRQRALLRIQDPPERPV